MSSAPNRRATNLFLIASNATMSIGTVPIPRTIGPTGISVVYKCHCTLLNFQGCGHKQLLKSPMCPKSLHVINNQNVLNWTETCVVAAKDYDFVIPDILCGLTEEARLRGVDAELAVVRAMDENLILPVFENKVAGVDHVVEEKKDVKVRFRLPFRNETKREEEKTSTVRFVLPYSGEKQWSTTPHGGSKDSELEEFQDLHEESTRCCNRMRRAVQSAKAKANPVAPTLQHCSRFPRVEPKLQHFGRFRAKGAADSVWKSLKQDIAQLKGKRALELSLSERLNLLTDGRECAKKAIGTLLGVGPAELDGEVVDKSTKNDDEDDEWEDVTGDCDMSDAVKLNEDEDWENILDSFVEKFSP